MAGSPVALSGDDIEKLFSGAPQFFARAEGHCTGAPHPSVAFPFDEELHIRDLTDHAQIEDPAWGCVTAWPHITRGGCEQYAPDGAPLPAPPVPEPSHRPHFYPRCREKPNMLSMQGLEKGTMGYQAALEIAVADALQEEQFGFEYLGFRATAIVEARAHIIKGPYDGIRRLKEQAVFDQLIRSGVRYRTGNGGGGKDRVNELYSSLFSDILYPPTRVLDRRDPQGLSAQIRQILKVLAAPNIWVDFSQVAWRIRLGQILWSGRDDVEKTAAEGGLADEGDGANSLGRHDEPVEERYWLLLQILLGCEMLIRLDAITEGDELGVEMIHANEASRFERDANVSVKWTLVLARCWLENIEVVKGEPAAPTPAQSFPPAPAHVFSSVPAPEPARALSEKPEEKPAATGWFTALAETVTFSRFQHPLKHAPPPSPPINYTIQGRHHQRQANGLFHFARKLRWPGVDTLAIQVPGLRRVSMDETPTMMRSRAWHLGSPTRTTHTPSDSSSRSRSSSLMKRGRQLEMTLQPSGWVSRSYLSGLMIPGESLGHLLMASLLESDAGALAVLGPTANLSGGFVYSGKSFWSTACVVGRVLAAGKGATECMGWVSSDVAPCGIREGWVDVKSGGLDGEMAHTGRRARLWDKVRVERESHILGSAQGSASVPPADFLMPVDGTYPEPPPQISVHFDGLRLEEVAESGKPDSPVHKSPQPMPSPAATSETREGAQSSRCVPTCAAVMSFRVEGSDGTTSNHRFLLKKDVGFITAHPCAPSHRVRLVRSSPSSPTIRQIDVSGNMAGGRATSLSGHPLHKSYEFTVVHLSELLARYPTSSLQELVRPVGDLTSSTSQATAAEASRMLVVDCITGFARPPQSPPSPTLPLSPSTSFRRNSGPGDDDGDGSIPFVDSPSSPVLRRGGFFAHNWPKVGGEDVGSAGGRAQGAQDKMHLESRKRQFGSDMEVLVRALCAEKGWNAVVSRRRRGCLACAIREAGALGWSVIIRVE